MWRKFALGVALIGLLGCEDTAGPGGLVDISGTWLFSETINAPQFGFTCGADGTVLFTQTGTTFGGSVSQQGICQGPTGQTIDNSGTGPVTDGTISGRTVTFESPFCTYTGTLNGAGDQMTGTSQCQLVQAGITISGTGTWEAER